MEKCKVRSKLKSIPILIGSIVIGGGYSIAKDPTPNLYLDVPAPILSQWNTGNVVTIDGISGATSKSYIYSSVEAAEKNASDENANWGDGSVAYITWELDDGSGRAPGIQVLNDNLNYQYHNCIMASGELEHPSFPDTIVSKACNDAQGSSKRYFFQLTETDKPIDLVFDLGVKDIRYKGLIDTLEDGEGTGSGGSSTNKDNTIDIFRDEYGIGRLYRVIQKIRNDTGKRIGNYKFEVGTGIGDAFETLSFEEHGIGFEMNEFLPRAFFDGRTGSAPDVKVWKDTRFATFAPKIFDDGVRPRFSKGFLDHQAAGYMAPVYVMDTQGKAKSIDSGITAENGIVGSLSENFFSVNRAHDEDLPYDMLGYMLPNSQVPSVISYWRKNDVNAEPDGIVAIWDGHDWRSGRAGLDGDPDTIGDNFGIIPDETLTQWARFPLGLDIPDEDPSELIRYAVIPSDDLAGINTDIFININEKLLNEQQQPLFDSITLRVTANSIDSIIPGLPGSAAPSWTKEGGGEKAPDLSTYAPLEETLVAFNDDVTIEFEASVDISPLVNDTSNGASLDTEAPSNDIEALLNDSEALLSDIKIHIVEGPINGSVKIVENHVITYQASDSFVGTEVFKYKFSKNDDVSNVASVQVVVKPEVVLDAPVVHDDNVMTMYSTPIVIDVLDNDQFNPDKQHMLEMVINNKPDNGEVTIDEDMNIVFTPDWFFIGITQFTYTIEEDGLLSNNAVVTVRVDDPEEFTENSEETPPALEDNLVSSGGGCTIGNSNGTIDPVLFILVVMSFIGLLRRRNQFRK